MSEEMYCILCHGRGLDNHDHLCQRCMGTGIEPDHEECLDTIEEDSKWQLI